MLALLNALAKQTGRAELGGDGCTRRLLVAFPDLAHDLPETARGEDAEPFRPCCANHRHQAKHRQQ